MDLSETGRRARSLRAGCLALLGVVAPLSAGADVIALFDEVADLTVTPPGILGRLVGSDGVVMLGNKEGPVWTDLSSTVAAPA